MAMATISIRPARPEEASHDLLNLLQGLLIKPKHNNLVKRYRHQHRLYQG
jgi:hypothetical protein